MACNSIRGLQIDACSPNIGGIKAIYLAEWAENAATIKVAEGENATELIDGAVNGFGEGVTWTKYDIRKNTASMTSTINNSTDGASYVTTELSLVFSKMEAKKRIAIQALAIGECIAVVEDSNGEMYFLGKDAPLTVTAGGGETGTAKGDRNAYTLTLTDESLGLPFTLDESAKTLVKGA
jgi:hypothetical protein